MATWVVTTFTVTGSPTADSNAEYGVTINESAPGDFDPAGVTGVSLTSLLATGSGFDGGASGDEWHAGSATNGDQTVQLFITGQNSALATNVATVANDQANAASDNVQKQAVSTAGSGGTIATNASTAQWEGARLVLSDTAPIIWFEYVKVKGGDASAITFDSASLTITYTPASPSEDVSVAITSSVSATDAQTFAYDETGRSVAITGGVTVTDTGTFSYDETGRTVAITAGVTVTDTAPVGAVTLTYDSTEPYQDSYIYTPDKAGWDSFTDLDLRVRIQIDGNYTVAGDTRLLLVDRYGGDGSGGTTPEEQFLLSWDGFDERIQFAWRDSGGTETVQTSPTTGLAPSAGDIFDIRIAMDVDVSGINYNLEFFTRTNSGNALTSDTGWTSAGTRTGSVTSFQATDQPIIIYNAGTSNHGDVKVLGVVAYDGTDNTGTLLLDPNFEDGTQTADNGETFIDTVGNPWYLSGSADWGLRTTPVPLPFIERFDNAQNGDGWRTTRWPTQTVEGSASAYLDIQSGKGHGLAGTTTDDFALAAANVIDTQDSEGRIRIEPVTADVNQWIYVVLRSSGDYAAANAGRPATAYYFRFALQSAAQESVDYLFRRLSDSESQALAPTAGQALSTWTGGGNVDRNAGEPFYFRWEVEDNGSNVDFRIKVWDADAPEPDGWATYSDTSPGALLGTAGEFALLFRTFNGGNTVEGRVDDIYFDALQAPQALPVSDDFAGTNGDWPDLRLWEPYKNGTDGAGIIDIQSNKLRLSAADTSGQYATVISRTVDQQNSEALVLIDPSNVGISGNAFFYVMLRSSGDPGTSGRPTTACALKIHVGNTQVGTADRFFRITSGSETAIGTNFGTYRNATEPFYIRMQVEDSGSDVIYRFKGWDAEGSEPGSWQYVLTDTAPGATLGASGKLQLIALDWVTDSTNMDMRVDSVDYTALAGGPTYDETGRTVAITASVSATSQHDGVEPVSVAASSTVAITDAHKGQNEDRTVAVSSTVTATDLQVFAFDETGRSVSITAGVTATDDLARYFDETGRSVAITANLTALDTMSNIENLAVSVTAGVQATSQQDSTESTGVSISSSVQETDRQDSTDALTVAITSSVTATDSVTNSYVEDVAVAVTAGVTATDDYTLHATEDVSVAVSATVTHTEAYTALETILVAVTSSVSATSQHDGVEPVTVAITGGVSVTDQHDTPGAYDETGRVVAVTASVTASSQHDMVEAATVAITGTATATDQGGAAENVTVAIAATVTATDVYTPGQQNYDETGRTVSVTATVGATDTASFVDALTVAATGGVTATDIYTPATITEDVAFGITASVSGTSQHDMVDPGASISIIATVTATDAAGAVTEDVVVAITSSVSAAEVWTQIENGLVPIVGSIDITDLFSIGEVLEVAITGAIVVTDRGDFIDDLAVGIVASVTKTDVWFITLENYPGRGQADPPGRTSNRGEADGTVGIGRARQTT